MCYWQRSVAPSYSVKDHPLDAELVSVLMQICTSLQTEYMVLLSKTVPEPPGTVSCKAF